MKLVLSVLPVELCCPGGVGSCENPPELGMFAIEGGPILYGMGGGPNLGSCCIYLPACCVSIGGFGGCGMEGGPFIEVTDREFLDLDDPASQL